MGKLTEAMMGFVIGDALGTPVEFEERDTYKIEEMTGYGTHNQPVGTWSDDTSMTLATMESIVRMGKIDIDDIMNNFSLWYNKGKFTQYGKAFDIGRATEDAINRYNYGIAPENCGGKDEFDNGNGSLMRILPLAFIDCTDEEIENVSKITHAHEISLEGCKIYVNIAKKLLKGMKLEKILNDNFLVSEVYSRIPNIGMYKREDIKSTGYIVYTLEAVLWCVLNTKSYTECVLTAVNLGDDTDTIGAIAGGIAGIIYGFGENGIPEKWINQINNNDYIYSLSSKMEKLIGGIGK